MIRALLVAFFSPRMYHVTIEPRPNTLSKEEEFMDERMTREIRQARQAGIRAHNSLRQAQRKLSSARGWGIFDLLGGGTVASLIKHYKLNDAQADMERARDDLAAFSRELRDVDMPGVDVGPFLTFADVFFDSFLADLMVQSRISDARIQIDRACARVEDILRRLPNV